ncbi:UNVERIFIED_CONTAM: hypothetical protein HDU68_010020 [Siphonaria sp. JEL0065]|nr:hypothetical protein HDU68_010020 [Siphonaria sp. JEL0065]
MLSSILSTPLEATPSSAQLFINADQIGAVTAISSEGGELKLQLKNRWFAFDMTYSVNAEVSLWTASAAEISLASTNPQQPHVSLTNLSHYEAQLFKSLLSEKTKNSLLISQLLKREKLDDSPKRVLNFDSISCLKVLPPWPLRPVSVEPSAANLTLGFSPTPFLPQEQPSTALSLELLPPVALETTPVIAPLPDLEIKEEVSSNLVGGPVANLSRKRARGTTAESESGAVGTGSTSTDGTPAPKRTYKRKSVADGAISESSLVVGERMKSIGSVGSGASAGPESLVEEGNNLSESIVGDAVVAEGSKPAVVIEPIDAPPPNQQEAEDTVDDVMIEQPIGSAAAPSIEQPPTEVPICVVAPIEDLEMLGIEDSPVVKSPAETQESLLNSTNANPSTKPLEPTKIQEDRQPSITPASSAATIVKEEETRQIDALLIADPASAAVEKLEEGEERELEEGEMPGSTSNVNPPLSLRSSTSASGAKPKREKKERGASARGKERAQATATLGSASTGLTAGSVSDLSDGDAAAGYMVKPVEERKCTTCGATQTPMWRKGPLGQGTLCNACGVKWRKKA